MVSFGLVFNRSGHLLAEWTAMAFHVLVDGKKRQVKQQNIKVLCKKQEPTMKSETNNYGLDYHTCLFDDPELGFFFRPNNASHNRVLYLFYGDGGLEIDVDSKKTLPEFNFEEKKHCWSAESKWLIGDMEKGKVLLRRLLNELRDWHIVLPNNDSTFIYENKYYPKFSEKIIPALLQKEQEFLSYSSEISKRAFLGYSMGGVFAFLRGLEQDNVTHIGCLSTPFKPDIIKEIPSPPLDEVFQKLSTRTETPPALLLRHGDSGGMEKDIAQYNVELCKKAAFGRLVMNYRCKEDATHGWEYWNALVAEVAYFLNS